MTKFPEIIYSPPKRGEASLPPVIIHEILDHVPLSEQTPGFLTRRGDYRKLKELTGDGEGIKVGVGDTGVDKKHLEGDLKGVVNAKDFTGSRYGYYDRHGHGSHTTGHIGSRKDGNGIEGLASSCKLVHAKVLGDRGSGSLNGIASGIRWMVDEGCHVINLSLGGSYSSAIEGACREAAQDGVMIFASMGNSGTRGSGHPGNSKYTFGIAAVDYNKKIAGFSSRGPRAKYSGYGVQVLSCVTDGQYGRMSGTSMSSPDVTGVATHYLSWRLKNGLPLPESMKDLEDLFQPGVEDLGTPGHDKEYGLGFIDIWKIIQGGQPLEPTLLAGVFFGKEGLFVVSPSGNLSTKVDVGSLPSMTGKVRKL